MKEKPYHEALGSYMWAQVTTHPNITFTLSVLSCFQANPSPAHWKVMLHLLAYLKGTLNHKIMYHWGGSLNPISFIYADCAGDTNCNALSVC